MKKTLLAVALAPLFIQSQAFATETSTDDVMVVTANRFEQPLSTVIASTDVVTKAQIESRQLKTLTDVLKWLPGVQVTNNGGLGQSSSVSIRGSSSKHVVVLYNGVRLGSATTGSANFSAIPLVGVEKVELVRGPRAAVYGADAIGGVINIVTTSHIEGDQGVISAGIGSDEYLQGQASVASQLGENSWLKVGVNSESAEGFDVSGEGFNPDQPDDDGFRRQDLSLELGSQFTPTLRGRVLGFYHTSLNEYEYYISNGQKSPDEQESKLFNVSGQLEYSRDKLGSALTISKNQDSSDNKGGEFPGSKIVTDRYVINWLNSYQLTESVLIQGGIDYQNDSVADSNLWNSSKGKFESYDGTSRYNRAAFLSSFVNLGDAQFEASIRYDDNEAFGSYTTWQLGAGYGVTDNIRVIASAGTGFQAPTFNDLYWPGYGNKELKPEESFNYEAGVEAYYSFADFRVVGYSNKIDNLITYQGKDKELESSSADIKGIEISANFDTGPFSHMVSLDLLDHDNKVNVAGFGKPTDIQSKKLARKANEVAKWLVSYTYDEWQADLSYMYQGKRYDDSKNTIELEPYSLVDVSASYAINTRWVVRGKVANLLDKEYQTANTYNTQRRAFYLTTTYQF
ncbi:TonB-dependent receptor domain-containing protein [Photobacterium swingsii]|uniref:TonB-dependent receptor domain-containing protein n=1 Tax=Photobacterium swingsii TaxID=680026 RepID=UPI00354BF19D